MTTVILLLIISLLAGAIGWKSLQYGDGNLWQGLKKFLDPEYQTDQDQNKDIEHGLFLLAQRMDAYHPRGWTVEFQQGQPDRPPWIRLISGETHHAGVYLYDSPAELLQKWSLPAQKEK